MTEYTQIEKAILFLADLDPDRAAEKNDAGFNAFDGIIGHSWANQILSGKPLTPGQEAVALAMLNKYRKTQLAGFDLPAKVEQSRFIMRFTVADGNIFVYFNGKPSPENLSKVKSVPGRTWASDLPGTPWRVPVKSARALVDQFPEAAAVSEITELLMVEPDPEPEPARLVQPDVKIRMQAINATTKVKNKDGETFTIGINAGDLLVTFPNAATRSKYVEALKGAIPYTDRRWLSEFEDRPWRVSRTYAIELVDLFPGANVTPEVAELVKQMTELKNRSNQAASSGTIPGLNGEPMPFQVAGVEFFDIAHGRALCGDDMGLGKTIQAIGYLQKHPELRPAFIVVPATLKLNWRREIRKWLTVSNMVAVLDGQTPSQSVLDTADVFIINYEILPYWLDLVIQNQPKLVIVDEAHYCKNRKAQRTQAVQKLSKSCEQILFLTGTPIVNRPVELYTILNMIDPVAWSNFMSYARAYCGAYKDGFGWHFDGAQNLEDLHTRIKPYVIRRTKAQVLPELPDKRRVPVNIKFSDRQRADYRFAINAVRAYHGDNVLPVIEAAKQAAVRGKLEYALEWVENFISNDEKLVVFCTHLATVDAMMEKFGNRAVKITGEVSQVARQEAIDRFQTDPDCLLFVGIFPKAAGVGITLTAASNVAFLEFAWTPGDHDQAEDRCLRIGQKNAVTVYYLAAEDTIDNDIIELLEAKRKIVETVHDGKPGALSFSIQAELLKRIEAEE